MHCARRAGRDALRALVHIILLCQSENGQLTFEVIVCSSEGRMEVVNGSTCACTMLYLRTIAWPYTYYNYLYMMHEASLIQTRS